MVSRSVLSLTPNSSSLLLNVVVGRLGGGRGTAPGLHGDASHSTSRVSLLQSRNEFHWEVNLASASGF